METWEQYVTVLPHELFLRKTVEQLVSVFVLCLFVCFLRNILGSKKHLLLCCLKSAGRDADPKRDVLREGWPEILDSDSSPEAACISSNFGRFIFSCFQEKGTSVFHILAGRDWKINTSFIPYQGDNCANFKLNWEKALVDRILSKSNKLLSGLNKYFFYINHWRETKIIIFWPRTELRIVLLLLLSKEMCNLEYVCDYIWVSGSLPLIYIGNNMVLVHLKIKISLGKTSSLAWFLCFSLQ